MPGHHHDDHFASRFAKFDCLADASNVVGGIVVLPNRGDWIGIVCGVRRGDFGVFLCPLFPSQKVSKWSQLDQTIEDADELSRSQETGSNFQEEVVQDEPARVRFPRLVPSRVSPEVLRLDALEAVSGENQGREERESLVQGTPRDSDYEMEFYS